MLLPIAISENMDLEKNREKKKKKTLCERNCFQNNWAPKTSCGLEFISAIVDIS